MPTTTSEGKGWTKGPWKTGDCDDTIVWAAGFRSTAWIQSEVGPEAVSICNVDMPGWANVTPPEYIDDPNAIDLWNEECRANARLIAAAPDLYEACAAVLRYDREDSSDVNSMLLYADAIAAAKAALAKAEGRST